MLDIFALIVSILCIVVTIVVIVYLILLSIAWCERPIEHLAYIMMNRRMKRDIRRKEMYDLIKCMRAYMEDAEIDFRPVDYRYKNMWLELREIYDGIPRNREKEPLDI